ncbi:MAG: sigma-70 family RNA polymerase sigma factor [Myxococcota bacterium]
MGSVVDGHVGDDRRGDRRLSASEAFEAHRRGLAGHCYRMLGSVTEADDAVQETMLRAWRGRAGLADGAAARGWLYRIATNVCLDQLRRGNRRELPVLEGPAGTPRDALSTKPRHHWLEPVADARALPPTHDVEQALVQRQSLRLAFVAALQRLPPRQRAVLLLKDVLGFTAAEIALTLDTPTTAVNSALQRARRTMAVRRDADDDPSPSALSSAQRQLVDDYVDAFHRYDIDRLVALVREDGTLSMPPFTLWLRGRDDIATWLRGRGAGCRGSRLVATAACGQAAFGQYRKHPDGFRAWSLIVLDLDARHIASMTHFLDVETLFPRFDLPLTL